MSYFSNALQQLSQTWSGLPQTQQIGTGAVVAISSFWLWRKWIAGGVNKYKPDLTGKVAVITGANTGIGLETAKFLAALNAEVYITVRDDAKGTAAVKEIKKGHSNDKVSYLKCELSSLQSVRQFVEEYKSRVNKKIDILIENAGVMVPPYTLTKDGFELQFGVNHLAHFLMTHLLLDHNLINENGGRVVVVSSMGHFGGRINYDDLNSTKQYRRWPAYFQSKLANVLFARELNNRMKAQGKNITAVSLHPGAVRTELDRNFPGIAQWIVFFFHRFFYKSAYEGAQTSLHCALAPHIEGGAYYSDCVVKKPNKLVTDEEAAKLWEVSTKLVGLNEL